MGVLPFNAKFQDEVVPVVSVARPALVRRGLPLPVLLDDHPILALFCLLRPTTSDPAIYAFVDR